MKLKMLIVSMLIAVPMAAYPFTGWAYGCTGQTFHLIGGGVSFNLYYSDLVNLRRLHKVGTNQCLEVVNPYSTRWTSCNNYVGQRFGTISNSLCGGFNTAVTSHLNGRVLTREDGLKVYNYTGRATQLWQLRP